MAPTTGQQPDTKEPLAVKQAKTTKKKLQHPSPDNQLGTTTLKKTSQEPDQEPHHRDQRHQLDHHAGQRTSGCGE